MPPHTSDAIPVFENFKGRCTVNQNSVRLCQVKAYCNLQWIDFPSISALEKCTYVPVHIFQISNLPATSQTERLLVP
jgi:hypothetical protein